MKKLIVVLSLISIPAFACMFDTDCFVGSKCVKSNFSMYGVCRGGLAPGNSNDNTPVYKQLDLNKTYGNTCQWDTECGPGSHCRKDSYSLYGTCM